MLHSRLSILLFVLLQLLFGTMSPAAFPAHERRSDADQNDPLVAVGVARIDVTPEGPIRLNGYAVRKTESTGVAQKLWAKALAIGTDQQNPAVLITVDNCVVPAELTEKIAQRLARKAGIQRERFVV